MRVFSKVPPLKLGLLGFGNVAASVHVPLLRKMPDIKLVAISETDPVRRESAERLASGVGVLTSCAQLLEIPELDAVVISLPNTLHAEAAVMAFEGRKHVYLEKPLAAGRAEAARVLEAWRRSEAVGMIGFNYRFNPLYERARRMLRDGVIGKPVCARSVFATSAAELPAWKRNVPEGGGVLADLGSHHIDMARFLFACEVKDVYGSLRSHDSEGDTAVLEFQLNNGVPIQSSFSWSAVEEDRFEIYGDAGKLTVDRYAWPDVIVTGVTRGSSWANPVKTLCRGLTRLPYWLKKMRSPWHEPSYRRALETFASVIRAGGKQVKPDLWDGYCSLAVVEAAGESVLSRRPVEVSVDHA